MAGIPPEHTRKLGKFTTSWDAIDHMPQVVRGVLSRMIVVRAEALYDMRAIEYTAICDDFDSVPLGQKPPFYEIEVSESITEYYITTMSKGINRKLMVLPKEER